MEIKFIYLESYGCTANQNNAEIMRGKLIESGLELTNNPKIADILILNTCIVKGPTENKMKSRVNELIKLNKPLIIAGCMPEVRKLPDNIYCLGIHHIKDIAKLIKKISEGRYDKKDFLDKENEIKINCPKLKQNKLIGITQISEGCLGNCNFCITKLAKGKLFSYPESKIIENIQKDLNDGCKEIWLTSQDNAAYGLDQDTNLISLLNKILLINAKFKLRLGMMNPEHVLPILDKLIELYKNEKMFKFLHVPVQSGSNKILKLMNRKYKKEDFLKIIKKFRHEIPDISLATDMIVAYPSEEEKDYKESLKLLEETMPDSFNLSKYWALKSTPAFLEKQVPVEISRRRAIEMQKLHLKLAEENNQKYIDTEQEVLIDSQTGTTFLGRMNNYKIVFVRSENQILGRKIKVKIKEAKPHYLVAQYIV